MTAKFPDTFTWGAATSAFQIEGAHETDGRGLSVWDMQARTPGRVFGGHRADVACDHYSRAAEDVALMAELGLQSYRFSVAWPRVFPNGTGAVNPQGLAFYDRLVDLLLSKQIEPMVTLFHWDMPLSLLHRGGWLNRDSVRWFEAYTTAVVSALGDRVKLWVTLNEPQVFVGMGHFEAKHAPGLALPFDQVLHAAHNVLMAHGAAVRAIRSTAKLNPQIGYSSIVIPQCPVSETPEDIAAARSGTFAVPDNHCWSHSWWTDPVILGHYPEEGLKKYGKLAPQIRDGDLELISSPVDFIGLNIYMGVRCRAGDDGAPQEVEAVRGSARTAFDWPVVPEAMYWGPRFFHERYGKQLRILENGVSTCDWPDKDGRVIDSTRILFTEQYLSQLRRAIDDGADVVAYYHWSLMDNFEWEQGYKQRFGLIHVDFETQRRTPKQSATWFRDVIRTNGSILSE